MRRMERDRACEEFIYVQVIKMLLLSGSGFGVAAARQQRGDIRSCMWHSLPSVTAVRWLLLLPFLGMQFIMVLFPPFSGVSSNVAACVCTFRNVFFEARARVESSGSLARFYLTRN